MRGIRAPPVPTLASVNERPTVPAWAAAVIRDLEKQIDRLMSGRACRECKGSGETPVAGKAGAYVRTCAGCDGHGLDSSPDT